MALSITPRDILLRWVGDNKPFSEQDETFNILFNDALDMITFNVKNIEELVSNGHTSISTVKQVMTAILTRYYSIAQEYRSSFSETVGSFSHSGSISSDKDGLGVMSILPNELTLLNGISKGQKVGSYQWATDHDAYWDGWVTINTYYNSEIAGVDRVD